MAFTALSTGNYPNILQTALDPLITAVNGVQSALDTAGIPPSTFSAYEAVSASGALATTGYTALTVSGTKAYTLANATVTGTIKEVECVSAASTPLGTLTITTAAGSEATVHTFTAAGQRLVLIWNGTGWHHIRKVRAGQQATTVGTTVLTGLDMCETYALSVTGTVSSTTTKGIPAGSVAGEVIHINTPTAASTPSGDIAITATTIATNAAATSLAGINATTVQASFVWDGASWQNISLTTATLS